MLLIFAFFDICKMVQSVNNREISGAIFHNFAELEFKQVLDLFKKNYVTINKFLFKRGPVV